MGSVFFRAQGTIEEPFKKAFAERAMAQGTIEYLLVVAVVVVVGLVAVGVLSGVGGSGDFERRSSSVSWVSGDVGLVEGLVDVNGEWVLAVRNNGVDVVFLDSIVVDGVVFDLNGFSLAGFAERSFLFKNDYSVGSCVDTFKAIDVSLKYVSRYGVSNVVSNNYKFYLDCVEEVIPNDNYIIFGENENIDEIIPSEFLLDIYDGAAFAYGLNVLHSDFENSPIIRIRRSSDNAESDFTADEILDGTLVDWVGSGDGFVRTWYDQRVSTSNSFSLFDGGGISGIPVTSFNTNNMDVTGFIKPNNTGSTARFIDLAGNTRIRISSILQQVAVDIGGTVADTTSAVFSSVPISNKTIHKIRIRVLGSDVSLWIDDISQGTITLSAPVHNTFNSINVGRRGSDLTTPFIGIIYDINLNGTDFIDGLGNNPENWNGGTITQNKRSDINYIIAKDATQTTHIRQPLIVENGELIIQENRPSLKFHRQFLNLGDFSNLTQGHVFVLRKNTYQTPPTWDDAGMWRMSTITGGISGSHYPWQDSIIYDSFGSTFRKSYSSQDFNFMNYHILSILSQPNNFSSYINKNNFFNTSSNTVSFNSNSELGREHTNYEYFYVGYIQTLILFEESKVDDLNDIIDFIVN